MPLSWKLCREGSRLPQYRHAMSGLGEDQYVERQTPNTLVVGNYSPGRCLSYLYADFSLGV
jgi:hypothetical protein